jgi:hypothetical protein
MRVITRWLFSCSIVRAKRSLQAEISLNFERKDILRFYIRVDELMILATFSKRFGDLSRLSRSSDLVTNSLVIGSAPVRRWQATAHENRLKGFSLFWQFREDSVLATFPKIFLNETGVLHFFSLEILKRWSEQIGSNFIHFCSARIDTHTICAVCGRCWEADELGSLRSSSRFEPNALLDLTTERFVNNILETLILHCAQMSYHGW